MSPEIQTDIFYSPPTSPCALINLECFYSAPSSPATYFDLEADEPIPKQYEFEDENANLVDDFEFVTSRRYKIDVCETEAKLKADKGATTEDQQKHKKHRKESLPAMAFADELFCDGKVMPLKPPPCHQYGSDGKFGHRNSSQASPDLQSRISFPRWSWCNNDFDPFLLAMKNVMNERTERHKINHRRALSMSPLQASNNHQPNEMMGCMSPSMRFSDTNTEMSSHQTKDPKRVAEPKGVLFARKARLVKIDPEWPRRKPAKTVLQGPIVKKAGENVKGNGESKRKRMKKLLYRSLSMRRSSDEQKQTEQTVEVSDQKIKRKLSFKSMGLVPRNEEKTKMTAIHYKARLSLCMGSGAKFVSDA